MKELRINWLAIVVGTVLMQVIPMIWYGQIFRTSWMDMNHITQEVMDAHKDGAGAAYTAGVLGAFIGVYMLARIFASMRVESAMRGLINGAAIGFAFTVMPLMCQNLFSFRPYSLSWIDGGQFTLGYALSGLILGVWRKYKD